MAGIFMLASTAFADSDYTVRKGDTLYSISRKYQITVAELMAANNISEGDVLKEGARLTIPSADIRNAAALSSGANAVDSSRSAAAGKNAAEKNQGVKSYEVKKGDTLYGISRKYGISLADLLGMNGLDPSSTIKVGQILKVSSTQAEKSTQEGEASRISSSASDVNAAEKNAGAGTASAGSSSALSRVGQGVSSGSDPMELDPRYDAVAKVKSATPVQMPPSVTWPLSNPTVKKIGGKVSGVLLTGRALEPVKAVREGTVMYTGVYRGFGEVVFVQSKTGLIYSYTGLGKVSCRKGDYVTVGTELGLTGRSEPSIKFMVFQNGMPIDPARAPRG